MAKAKDLKIAQRTVVEYASGTRGVISKCVQIVLHDHFKSNEEFNKEWERFVTACPMHLPPIVVVALAMQLLKSTVEVVEMEAGK